MACLTFVVVILLEGSAFHITGGTLAGPAHPTVPAPPSGLRHVEGPLMHLPADQAVVSTDDPLTYRYMIWSTEGFPKLVNGISGFIPSRTVELSELASGFPDRRSVAVLRGAGIRSVVFHPTLAAGTLWARAPSRSVAGLGIERRLAGDVVVYDLTPRAAR